MSEEPKRDERGAFRKRFITYQGQTKCLSDWRKEISVSKSTLETRLKKFDKGLLTIDEVFAPPEKPGATSAKCFTNVSGQSTGGPRNGLRVRCNEEFFRCFNNELLPFLENEMKEYVTTGKMGNCMKAFKEFREYLIPRHDIESLDGASSVPKANFAVIFAGNEQPKNFTVMDV